MVIPPAEGHKQETKGDGHDKGCRCTRDGKGWVDYMYKNPENGKVEAKTAYVLRSGDLIFIAGIYKK